MNHLVLLLLAPLVLSDVELRQGNVKIGPVRAIDCKSDGGFYCTRDAGEEIGRLSCASATASEPGCVTPSAQSWAGTKTLTGDMRLVGHVHGSLSACAAGTKGTWQTCTTHNAPVFCNGTTNLELTGSNSYVTLGGASYIGLFYSLTGFLGALNLPYAYTVTNMSGYVAAGTGAGSINLLLTDGTNLCTCAIDCDTDQSSYTCTGNCTYAASTLVAFGPASDTCTTPPTIRSPLILSGYK